MVEFSAEQEDALQMIGIWLNTARSIGGAKSFYLGGYAGSGKTTLAKEIARIAGGEVYFVAPTGKAAYVLTTKDCPNAATYHSVFFRPKGELFAEEISYLKDLVNAGAANDDQQERLNQLMHDTTAVFEAKEEPAVKSASLVVCDEASMVTVKDAEIMEAFGVPILWLGDPGQLPPVGGKGVLANRRPDYFLKEIHRQAADSKIIRLATAMRQGKMSALKYGDYGDVVIAPKSDFDWDLAREAGQIITGRHTSRRAINRSMRKRAGMGNVLPVAGDKLICKKNDREKGLLNGVTCTALKDSERFGMIATLCANYDGRRVLDHCDPGPFEEHYGERKSYPNMRGGLTSFDYGYAITCHSSQGSQWDHTIVADDRMQERNGEFRKRWLYTAFTRAAKQLTIYR